MTCYRRLSMNNDYKKTLDKLQEVLQRDFSGSETILDALYYLKKRLDEQEMQLNQLEHKSDPYKW